MVCCIEEFQNGLFLDTAAERTASLPPAHSTKVPIRASHKNLSSPRTSPKHTNANKDEAIFYIAVWRFSFIRFATIEVSRKIGQKNRPTGLRENRANPFK